VSQNCVRTILSGSRLHYEHVHRGGIQRRSDKEVMQYLLLYARNFAPRNTATIVKSDKLTVASLVPYLTVHYACLSVAAFVDRCDREMMIGDR